MAKALCANEEDFVQCFLLQGKVDSLPRGGINTFPTSLAVELVDVVTLQRVFEPTRHEADSAPFVAFGSKTRQR